MPRMVVIPPGLDFSSLKVALPPDPITALLEAYGREQREMREREREAGGGGGGGGGGAARLLLVSGVDGRYALGGGS